MRNLKLQMLKVLFRHLTEEMSKNGEKLRRGDATPIEIQYGCKSRDLELNFRTILN
jgi:hypothetical protein